MSTEHRIKVAPPYFDSLLDGSKTFEVRRNDRSYQAGDTLVLVEINDKGWTTGRQLERRVSFVYSGDPRFGGHGGMQPGYVVLGLGASDGGGEQQ